MQRIQDHYFQKAKKEKYPARSVYKLQEMDKRFRLFKRGQKVLDLGAAPGSWALYAADKVSDQGSVLAVDIKEPPVSFPGNVSFLQADIIEDTQARDQVQEAGPFHVILSDMAPNTTGIKITDQARSLELAQEALWLGQSLLTPDASLVLKLLEGPDVPELRREMQACFQKVKHFKPKSSRSESMELFLIGMGYRARADNS